MIVNSGASTQLVNELIITGFAASQSGYGVPTSSGTDAQKLAQINNAFALNLGSYAIDTCFYYGAASSSNPNSCNVTNVNNPFVIAAPEPASLVLAALASLWLLPTGALALRRWHRL